MSLLGTTQERPAPRRTSWVLWLLLALSFGLNWPYLGSGFLADEVVILSAMEEDPLPYSRWRGAWSGDPEDVHWFGTPWWAESGAMGSFFRPLPSLVFEGSLRIFGKVAFPLHLLAVVLHGVAAYLLVLALLPLFGRVGPPLTAGILWVACEDHSMTVGYPSFATDIICVVFIMLALLAHLRWLRTRRWAYLAGAVLATLGALTSKETGVIAPVVLLLTSLLFPRGEAMEEPLSVSVLGDRARALWRRPSDWMPWVVVLLGFLGAYAALNLGGMDNLMYIDPLENPGRYLSHLVIHLPVMWLATVTVFPPGAGFMDPALFPPMAVAGVVVLPLFLWALWGRLRQPVVVWALALYLLALLPQLGTDAGERLLYLPFMFASVPLALLVLEVGPLARRLEGGAIPPSRLRRAASWYVLMGVGVAGLILSAVWPFAYVAWTRPMMEAPRSAATHMNLAHQHAVFLNTSDAFGILMVPTLVPDISGLDVDVRILSSVDARMQVRRTGERSFVLTADRPGWVGSFLSAAFRTTPTLSEGATYPGDLYDVTLLGLTAQGDDVLEAEFTVHQALDDPSVLYLYWDGSAYQPLALAELPLNESVPLWNRGD